MTTEDNDEAATHTPEPLQPPTGPRTAWAAVIEAVNHAFPDLRQSNAKAGVTHFIASLHTLGWTLVPVREHHPRMGDEA